MSLPLLILTSAVMYGVYISMTAPVLVRNNEKSFSAENPYFMLICLRTLNIASSVISVIEILLLGTSSLAVHLPQSTFTMQLRDQLYTIFLMSSGHAVSASPIRILAGLAVVTGALIRWRCYREMGRQYTFRVTVLKSHTLVTTGPYSIVRHPGYSGGMLLLVALPFWQASHGGWLWESELARGNMTLVWYLVTATFVALAAPVAWVSVRRASGEEALMRKKFGKEWEDWAETTPHKFIPGII